MICNPVGQLVLVLGTNVARGATGGIVLQLGSARRAGGHDQGNRWAGAGIQGRADITRGTARRRIGNELVIRTSDVRKVDCRTGWTTVSRGTACRRDHVVISAVLPLHLGTTWDTAGQLVLPP